MGVRSELSLRLLRVDHRRDLRRLVAWMKASTGTSRTDAATAANLNDLFRTGSSGQTQGAASLPVSDVSEPSSAPGGAVQGCVAQPLAQMRREPRRAAAMGHLLAALTSERAVLWLKRASTAEIRCEPGSWRSIC